MKQIDKVMAIICSAYALFGMPQMGTEVRAETAENGLVYEIADGEVSIIDCDENTAGDVIVPATIEGYPVTAVADFAFVECSLIRTVTLPESVAYLGWMAFFRCTALESVNLPGGLTVLREGLFSECTSLRSVDIPDTVTVIENDVFCACHSLTEIIVPESVASIGGYPFTVCDNLKKIVIPASVTEIGAGILDYSENAVIYGEAGSYAETYELENGYVFLPLSALAADANCDGLLTIADAVAMMRCIAEDAAAADDSPADCNEDGLCDLEDVQWILEMLCRA